MVVGHGGLDFFLYNIKNVGHGINISPEEENYYQGTDSFCKVLKLFLF